MNKLISFSGNSTGNGAGWFTRRALSGGMSHRSRVSSMNSSVARSFCHGKPSARRTLVLRARSKRPLLATMTRSVTSRNTGFVGLRNEPHAHDPLAPSAFRHTISPRNNSPSWSCKMCTMSADRLRNGLRPRLATFTAMRPPGSSVRTHSANTARSNSRYSMYELGTPSLSSSSS